MPTIPPEGLEGRPLPRASDHAGAPLGYVPLLYHIETILSERAEATRILAENVNRVPTLLDRETAHITTLIRQLFEASKEAVSAALAAQKEAAATNNLSTAEQIRNMSAQMQQMQTNLTSKIEDIKERVNLGQGNRAGRDYSLGLMFAVITSSLALITVLFLVFRQAAK
jgi:hypothetical protein